MGSDLATSFEGVADAYERGRPRLSADIVGLVARAAGGERILDVGAGTGRLAAPLARAGLDVVAVEPAADMRAVLARAIGDERALAGRAEALPLANASVDGAVCCDAWHWFDRPRAADELARVVRPGGGVVIVATHGRDDDIGAPPAWIQETGALLDPLWKAADHPFLAGSRRPDGLDGHPVFEPFEVRDEPFVHHTDRAGLMAQYASISYIAAMGPARRAKTMAALEAILVRHGVGAITMRYRAELWVTRRRPAQGPPAGRAAAAS